jgi:hypothetical protein
MVRASAERRSWAPLQPRNIAVPAYRPRPPDTLASPHTDTCRSDIPHRGPDFGAFFAVLARDVLRVLTAWCAGRG